MIYQPLLYGGGGRICESWKVPTPISRSVTYIWSASWRTFMINSRMWSVYTTSRSWSIGLRVSQ